MKKTILFAVTCIVLSGCTSKGDKNSIDSDGGYINGDINTEQPIESPKVEEHVTDVPEPQDKVVDDEQKAVSKQIDALLDEYQDFVIGIKETIDEGVPGSSSLAMRVAEKSEEIHNRIIRLAGQMTSAQENRYNRLNERESNLRESWE